MRLTFNADFNNTVADLERAAADLTRWQRAVSSGRRIQVASDDPAAVSRVISERAELGSIDRYVRSVDSVSSRLSVVDTVVSDVISRITNARATAAGARGSVPTAPQREAAAQALIETKDALLADLNYTFRGIHIFSGSSTTRAPYVKQPDGTVSAYQGDAQPVSVDVDRAREVAVTFDGRALAQGGQAQDIFASLDALVAAVRAGDDAGIEAGLQQLEQAFDRAVALQSSIGTQLAALDDQRIRFGELRRASTALVSADEDANMAEAISKMTQAETAYRTALAAIATRSRLTLLDYLR